MIFPFLVSYSTSLATGKLKQSHILSGKWCNAVLHKAKDSLMTTTAREYCWQVAFVSLWKQLWWRWQRKKGWWLGLCPAYLWQTLTRIITLLAGITLVWSRWMFWDLMVRTYWSGDGVVTVMCGHCFSALFVENYSRLIRIQRFMLPVQAGPWPNPTPISPWIGSVLMWPADLSVCFSRFCLGFKSEG